MWSDALHGVLSSQTGWLAPSPAWKVTALRKSSVNLRVHIKVADTVPAEPRSPTTARWNILVLTIQVWRVRSDSFNHRCLSQLQFTSRSVQLNPVTVRAGVTATVEHLKPLQALFSCQKTLSVTSQNTKDLSTWREWIHDVFL